MTASNRTKRRRMQPVGLTGRPGLLGRLSVMAACAAAVLACGVAFAESTPTNTTPVPPKPPGTAEAAAHTASPVPAVTPSDPKTAAAKKPNPSGVAPTGSDPHWAMLGNYCQKCHNAEDWA